MVFGFRLRQELGRGAFACVFLAEQADLARRPVVLKISSIAGNEPQTLAQLQHTHIVPIHSLHEDKQAGLRAVCMPYFGGASLSRALRTLWEETAQPAQGRQLVKALGKVSSSLPVADHQRRPALNHGPLAVLNGSSYVRAAVWLVARLADGLAHAHQRGVLHRDIKPSNILLAADGQPMLLDFNLAQNLHSGQAQAAAVLGGTVAYMAPEHLRALATRDPAQARHVDRRADIYSLGMVLYEMLAGCKPFDQSGSYSPLLSLIEAMALERSRNAPSLRQHRSDIPWSMESIARKCLAPDPARRYQQAEHLTEDLRCFLEDRPLKHAPELSRVERVRKWMRRHPRLSSSGSVATVAALLLLGTGVTLFGVREHLATTQQELQVVQAQERKRAFEEGTTRALCLVNTTTVMPDHLPQGLAACETTLALYGVLDRDDWQDDASWQLVAPDERQRLAEDTRELLLLLAWARVRQAPDQAEVLRDALALLDRAAAIQGLAPSRALWEDRAWYLDRLGEAVAAQAARATADQIQPASARDHYLLATIYARSRAYAKAVAELDEALRLNPRHFWSLVQRGICYQEMDQYTLAAGDFGASIGLWPEFAWGHFNRDYALDRSGHKAEAIKDYTEALKRDPVFVVAYLNRGMVYLELKQFDQALADFQKAAQLGRDDASLYASLGAALEGLGKHAEADQAFQTAFARAERAAGEVGARVRLVYGFAVASRLPERAQEAFEQVVRHESPLHHSQALYGRAMLLVEAGQLREALPFFSRALEAAPGFMEARRFRAIIQARCGQFEGACQDINWCLDREPEGGASLYAAACVTALWVEKMAHLPAAKGKAVEAAAFLRKAFSHGYGREKAAQDPDLKGIRGLPEFQQLFQG
jgi:serine/threonine protein kinase/tetratricopeptide (TPR) repeat protein